MKKVNVSPIKIFDQEIQPGKQAIVRIPAPKLYNYTPVFLPVYVLHGEKPGPVLCITAALHGDEVNGTETIRRLLKKPLLPFLSGTIIALPVVNIYGFLFQDRYLPDRRDLNRSFPGSGTGSLASRFARLLGQIVFSNVTHCIDLHTGSFHRTNFPQVRVDAGIPAVMNMAKAFNAPIILPAPPREGSFREYAKQKNIPYILYEAGEASRFDEICIDTGVRGILGVMEHLKMLPATVTISKEKKIPSKIARSSYWVRSPYGGIFVAYKVLGNKVVKGDVLGVVVHPAEGAEQKIVSPIAGIIIGKSDSPMIHEGAALFHIACFLDKNSAAKKTEWLKDLNEMNEDDKLLEAALDG